MSSSPSGRSSVTVSLSCRPISQASTSSVTPFSSCTGSQSNLQSYSMTYSSLTGRAGTCEGGRTTVGVTALAAARVMMADQHTQTVRGVRIIAVPAGRPAHSFCANYKLGNVIAGMPYCRGYLSRPRITPNLGLGSLDQIERPRAKVASHRINKRRDKLSLQ